MPGSDFSCPCCLYSAPLSWYENVGEGYIRCRRCRSRIPDPNAFLPETSYADCDSLRPVTRFPFSLRRNSAAIRVREEYLALMTGADGQRLWLEPRDGPVANLPIGCQLYYICLSPRILWGTSGVKEFGAYGAAQLSLTRRFVERYCRENQHIQMLNEYLQKAVSRWVSGYIEMVVSHQRISMLEQRDGYMSILGQIEEGVQLIRIDPMGFRNGKNRTGTFLSSFSDETIPEPTESTPTYRSPVDFLKTPKNSYSVKTGTEEVYIRDMQKMERHKAGEKMDEAGLRGVTRVFRFQTKEFELPYGWGIYNQTSQMPGYFSAQGTISFYIDSTERMTDLMNRTKSWQEFMEHFFINVLKNEMSTAMKAVLNAFLDKKRIDPHRISDHLSAMSIYLTNYLNGEDENARAPAFRPSGLRVKRADILGIDFYSGRR